MADIHILECVKDDEQRKVNVIFHVAITSPVANVIPTPTSSVPGIAQAEIDALAGGTLYEYSTVANFIFGTSLAQVAAQLKLLWQRAETVINNNYNKRYEYYGQTLNV